MLAADNVHPIHRASCITRLNRELCSVIEIGMIGDDNAIIASKIVEHIGGDVQIVLARSLRTLESKAKSVRHSRVR